VRHTGDCGRARDAPTNSGRTTKNGGSRLRLPPSDPRRSAQSAAVPPPNAAQARIAGRTLVWFAIAHTQHRGLGRLDLDARSAVARQRRGGRVGVAGWVFPSLFFPNSLGMFSSAPSSGMWLGALLPSASPHFSPDFVARVFAVRRMPDLSVLPRSGKIAEYWRGASRSAGDADVLGSTSRTPCKGSP